MWRAIILLLFILFLGAVAAFSTFHSVSVCGVCGCQNQKVEFQLPFIPLTYWRSQSVSATSLSTLAQNLNVTPPHTHDWKFIHGGGNGILCALGSGGDIAQNSRSPQVVSFLADTHRYRDKQEATHWFQTALHATNARPLRQWLLVTQFPESGYDLSADYEAWRERADAEWPELLEMSQSR